MYQTFLKPLFTDIKTFVLDTLFPISCLSCGTEGAFVCDDCKSAILKLEHQRCIVCQKQAPFGFTHPACLTPHGADGLISVLNYHDQKVADIVIKGKYHFLPGLYLDLGKIMATHLSTHYPLLTTHYYLVPIPLHSSRKRWRGFNQAEVLCQTISKELSMPISTPLIRVKSTKTQKDLKKEARIKNVSHAFSLKPDANVHGQNLILIDDVTTTGSTLNEAAKILKRNGAAKVICLTIARD